MDKYSDENEIFFKQLMSVPKKNIESKIIRLEKEIHERARINENSILKLSMLQNQLKERCEIKEYVLPAFSQFNELKRQIAQLEIQKIRENNTGFEDISRLQEKLHLAKEELELSELRFNLLR